MNLKTTCSKCQAKLTLIYAPEGPAAGEYRDAEGGVFCNDRTVHKPGDLE